ncbi:uncharacterized protein BDZ99DRAFT_276087 [Mytilinidion resinicola]|uniref:Uncharacterized protein n=1 Tax=Mytilinidion resinicola TaxID=574789 RepID=A0A6A6YU26_9PEZI|nr:uncharacterized protein BDZ99DRAFT_276087 [Mytilinidion resinicola]KAF2811475.1 hypothetical protein BDZ99DRAFT_276087 [Mytilinidion resinicola]
MSKKRSVQVAPVELTIINQCGDGTSDFSPSLTFDIFPCPLTDNGNGQYRASCKYLPPADQQSLCEEIMQDDFKAFTDFLLYDATDQGSKVLTLIGLIGAAVLTAPIDATIALVVVEGFLAVEFVPEAYAALTLLSDSMSFAKTFLEDLQRLQKSFKVFGQALAEAVCVVEIDDTTKVSVSFPGQLFSQTIADFAEPLQGVISATIYVDDTSITECPPKDNVLKNGDFEFGEGGCHGGKECV